MRFLGWSRNKAGKVGCNLVKLVLGCMKTKSHFGVKQFVNKKGGSVSWRVEGYDGHGHQIKKNFVDKFDALKRAAEFDLERAQVAGLVTLKRTALSEIDLADARSALRLLDGVASLVQAATYYRQHWQPGVDMDK